MSKRSVQVDDFTSLQVLSDPQFAMNGQDFFYVSTTIKDKKNYESHIYRYNQQKQSQWTYGHHQDSHPRVSPDGTRLVFQSNRSGTNQIWLMSLLGGEAEQLTTLTHGATNPEWSKDGKTIFFSALLDNDDDVQSQRELTKEEKEKKQNEKKKQPLIVNRLKYKSDARGFHDDKSMQILAYDLQTKQITPLTCGGHHHYFQDVSPDGNTVLFTANLNENEDEELYLDLYTLHIPTRKITKINQQKGSFYQAAFSPTGKYIACFGHDFKYMGATLTDLYIFDLNNQTETCLSYQWDIQLGDAMIGDTRLGASQTGPVWNKDETALYFIATDHGATGLYKSDLNGHLEPIYHNHSHVFGFSYDSKSDAFIFGMSTPTDPGNFYYIKENGKMKQLTDANKDYLNRVTLSEPEEIQFTTSDGWPIQGWLLRPYGFKEGKKYPLVLEVHGGPHAMYGQTYFHELQLLAAKGYVVLYTNPRGSHGYGQKFVDACRGDYGGKDYRDLMEAVDYALKSYSFIDETRMGVTGGSYGGFMTNWIVSHTNRFKAAVTQRSISNWLSFYGVSDIGFFFTKWEHGYNLLENPEKLWDFSPLKYAKNVETPLLILHGEQDLRCPIEQAEQLFITLKHLKKEVEFVRFPGANHELSRSGEPQLRIERLNHICRWFEKHL
ncbi:acylaminoacyl-peptidase [Cerasibacillus quisquiliarum]|uniref:Putative peptidase YuxL n=1 Tax=Cerasibacillus quisquiliarum TaxID=227865 RepID=A0A511UZ70_9BACI|nr:S9 family peptidase [Cerasibacillus quisquiliarum]MBB5146437.1 acylaminoacyl-peptidase [Cerasibacillus quisquiliarum]GEN30763.1 putative peptidase YuxL [Cerasibacillus quisquiliarum]